MIGAEELADAQVPNTPEIPWNCADESYTASPVRKHPSTLFASPIRSLNTSPRSPRHEHEKRKGLGNRSNSFGQGQPPIHELAMKDKEIELARLKLEIEKTINERNNCQTEASLRQMQQNETAAQVNLEQITVRAKPKENSNGEENLNKRNKGQEITQMHLELEDFERKREHDIDYGKQQREVEILNMQNNETVRKREHEYKMTKLKYDHDLTVKTNALEIMKCRVEIEKEKSKRHSRQINDSFEARKHKEQMAKLKQRDVEVMEEIQRMPCVESERRRQDSQAAAGYATTLGMPVAVILAHFLITWTTIRYLQK